MPWAPLGTPPDTPPADTAPASARPASAQPWLRRWQALCRGLARRLGQWAGEPHRPAADPGLWRALQRSQALLAEAEQQAGLGSFDWSPASGELHWSDQHFRLWGLTPGSLVPDYATFRRGVHPDDLAGLEAQLRQALDGGGRYDCRHRVLTPDGRLRHIHACGRVQFDAAGQAVRMMGTVRDIGAQHLAELQLHRYEHVVNSITDPISVVDDQLVYRLVNQAWSRNLGLTPDQVVGRSVEELLGPVLATERRQALQRCLAQQRQQHVRSRFAVGHDQARWWETTLYPYQALSEGTRGVVVISRDVSPQQATQEALAASLDNLRLTLNATGDGIFASDARSPDEPLMFVNDRLLQIWQIPPAAAATLTQAGVIAAAERFFIEPERERARIAEIIAGGQPQEDRLQLTDQRVLLRRCIPTQAAGREVRVWSFRDITVQAHAQQGVRAAEARQRALLDAFPGFIACIDVGGDVPRYTYANPQLAALLERPVSAIVGHPVAAVVGPERARVIDQFVQRALAGERVQHERYHPAAHGRPESHVLITVAPGITDDRGHRLVYLFGTDITPLKQTEAALVQAKETAERANQAKTVFLSSMSHELRTPLNAVLGFAQLLSRDPGLAPPQQARADKILRGGRHLLALIDDLLDLDRIETDRPGVRPTAVALDPLAEDCVALTQASAQRRQIELTLLRPPAACTVWADATRLQQVLVNLLSNAVKYSDEGGRVQLHWRQDGAVVTLTVQDDGPGLSEAQQARLFQPFERLDAAERGIEGTGIGLALSQRLVQRMGGAIGVHSRPGQGCRFWIALPASAGAAVPGAPAERPAADNATLGRRPARPDAPAAPAAPAATDRPTEPLPGTPAAAAAQARPPDHAASNAGRRQRTVLYIEDNPINTELMAALLATLPGVEMLSAATPEAGLARVHQAPPDLVLVDIQLPGMDGYAVLQHLRADPTLPRMPVLAVSANAMPQDLARGQRAGFTAYLTKPLDVAKLLRAVTAALGLPMPDGLDG